MRTTVDTFRRLLSARIPTPYVGRVASIFDRYGAGAASGDKAAQLAAFGSVSTLFAIVSNLAEGTSGVEWHLYRKRVDQRRRYGPHPEDERVEVLAHQALRVQQQPNPFMPWQEFCEVFQQHLDLVGETAWSVEYAGSVPKYLWPVRPDRLTPVADREKFLAGWTYRAPDGEEVPLTLNQVIHTRMPNPMDPYRGMGPVQALLTDLDSARYSAEWNRAFFRNSAQPGGIIEVESALSDKAFKQMVARWRESHQGVSNAHRVGILEYGKWKDVSFSMKDMQFAELRGVAREIIREAYSYPKFLLGEPEGSNRASAEAAEYVEARRLLVPRAKRIKGTLNSDYLPLFGATGTGVEFDFDSPVPEDEDAEAARNKIRAETFATLLGVNVEPEDAAMVACLPPMRMVEPEPVPEPLMPPADPGDDDDEQDHTEPAEPMEDDVAARAREILRGGGLARAIINGHSFTGPGR